MPSSSFAAGDASTASSDASWANSMLPMCSTAATTASTASCAQVNGEEAFRREYLHGPFECHRVVLPHVQRRRRRRHRHHRLLCAIEHDRRSDT